MKIKRILMLILLPILFLFTSCGGVDYAALTNTITSTIMKANVTVYTESYNSFLGFTTSSVTSLGSGIIYGMSSNGYYMLITNNHVTVKQSSYDNVRYTIEDYKGNTYTGAVYAMKAEYDLSVMYFKKGDENLHCVDISLTIPKANDEIVSLGQPKGQSNAISYGKILAYESAPKLSNSEAYQSNVTFDVIKHNCNTDSGSSGGAVLNTDLEIIGINYAGSSSNGYSYAIPILKVREFISKYVNS